MVPLLAGYLDLFFFFVVGKLIERVDVEFRFGRFADGEGRFKTF